MAIAKRFRIGHDAVFPYGAFQIGDLGPVWDFERSSKDAKVQQVDKDSGLPLWSVDVVDADPEAGKKAKTVTVKIAAKVQPVPPEALPGLPFRPVVFEGLTALPYIDDSGNFARIAWSYKADGITGPKAAAPKAVAS